MKKPACSFLAVMLAVSMVLPAYAATPSYEIMPLDLRGTIYDVLNSAADWIDGLAPDFWAGGGFTRGGGAGRRDYYTQPSTGVPGGPEPTYAPPKYGTGDGNTASGSGATNNYTYSGGTTNRYSVFKPITNNYTTNYYDYNWYNPVTNNYQSITQNTTVSYSPTYNTYNITNNEYNTYITNNNTYISYYIIDPVEELSWYYEIYYALPDGRNSYDLEAKDVWGQYFFYDATNYQEVVEDDGTTLALLHFDGNLRDSSAHNCNVSYETGANYNFVESDFTGALYWNDGVEHKLNITLPENLSGDFTIEGRINVLNAGSPSWNKFSNNTFESFDWGGSSPSGDINFVKDWITNNKTFVDFGSVTYKTLSHEYGYRYNLYGGNFIYPIFYCSIPLLYVSSVPVVYSGTFYAYTSFSSDNFWGYVYPSHYSDGSIRYQFQYVSKTANPNYDSDRLVYTYYPEFNISSSCSFALVRRDNTLHYFVNGLEIYSCESSDDLGNIVHLQSSADAQVWYDELRVSNKALYTDTYTPSAQPFDTNLVLAVPETGSETSIAIKSNIPVANLRVGGVRPTYPSNGDVYVYLENNIVKDVQQYQVDGWYSVTASIYENGKWTPFNGKDVSTYQVNEPDPVEPDPTPTPGPGGDISTGETPGGGGTGGDDDDGGIWDFLSDLFGGLIDLLASLVGGAVKMLAGVLGGLVDLFKSLLSFVSGFTDFLTAAFGFLPTEMLQALSAGIILMVIIAIIKFIGGFL